MSDKFQISKNQIDALLAKNTAKLARGLADSAFAVHGYYAPMPPAVRTLLAEAGVKEARAHGMTSTTGIIYFVHTMVDMTPRFPEFEPFKTILAQTDLLDTERMERIMSDAMLPHWDAVMEHLQNNNDWHVGYWNEHVDWSRLTQGGKGRH
jgi:hypothetical protein